MKQLIKTGIIVMLLTATSLLSYGQYLNKLYDYDSLYNWGWDITIRADSNYFIIGWSQDQTTGQFSIFNTTISNSANTVLSEKTYKNNSGTLGNGDPGQIQQLANGGYILPYFLQWPNGSYTNSAAGFMKLNEWGDTVFAKTYTDTSLHFDLINACAVMPNDDYIGGGRGLNTPSAYPAFIVRTDSMGDTLWTHTYQKFSADWAEVHTLSALADGRILAGASTTHQVILPNTETYDCSAPWFMLLDSAGHILKDTAYTSGFMGGGAIYPDKNGGYIHIGDYDSLFTNFPSDAVNFPSYIAHLDTNFRITWIREFPYAVPLGHREKSVVRQLQDSTYVLLGACNPGIIGQSAVSAWAAKISRNGDVLWSRLYASDTVSGAESYFSDMVELPNGHLVFVGQGFNDSLPSWRQGADVWLLEVDENGCEVPGCTTGTSPQPSPKEREVLRVWPNPCYGAFNVSVADAGTVGVYNIEGQVVMNTKVQKGINELQLPAWLSAGMYMCRYVPADGGAAQVVRVVVER